MVRKGQSIETRSVMTIGKICLTLMIIVVSTSWGGQSPGETQKGCVLAKVLENPSYQARYRQSLANAKYFFQENKNSVQGMYGNIIKASINSEDGKDVGYLDSFTTGCVTCHSGIVNPKDKINFKNDPAGRMQMMSGKHPIGMDYEQYARSRDTLKKLDELSPNIILVGGKVSCVTCHDLLSSTKDHLVKTEDGRGLCYECHNM